MSELSDVVLSPAMVLDARKLILSLVAGIAFETPADRAAALGLLVATTKNIAEPDPIFVVNGPGREQFTRIIERLADAPMTILQFEVDDPRALVVNLAPRRPGFVAKSARRSAVKHALTSLSDFAAMKMIDRVERGLPMPRELDGCAFWGKAIGNVVSVIDPGAEAHWLAPRWVN